MSDKYDVNVKISFTGADQAVKTFRDISKALGEVEKVAKNVGKGMRDFGKSLSLYVTAPLTALNAIGVNSFMQNEKALNNLNIALRNAGTYTKEASNAFVAFSKELERNSILSGDVILNAAAMARNFTATDEQARKLVQTAADLSAATGDSLDSSIRRLGNSLNGVMGQLALTVPEVRNLREEQLKAGAAIDIVARKYGGSARDATNTLSGQITQLKNEFGTLAESIAMDFIPAIQNVVRYARDMIRAFQNLDPELRKKIILFGSIAAAIGPVVTAIGGLVSLAGVFVSGLKAMATAASILVKPLLMLAKIIAGPAGLVLAVASLTNLFVDLREAGVSTGDALVKIFHLVASAILNTLGKALLWAVDKVLLVTEKIYRFLRLEGLADQANEGRKEIDEWAENISGYFSDSVGGINSELEKSGKTLGSSLSFGLTDVLSDTFSGLSDMFSDLFTAPAQQDLSNFSKGTVVTVKKMSEQVRKLLEDIGRSMASSFTSAFMDLTKGTKSASDAFKDFATSAIDSIQRIIMEALILQGLTSAFPNIFGTATAANPGGSGIPGAHTGGAIINGRLKRYHSGGRISGPGGPTSDSMIIRASNGEYMLDKKTTDFIGRDNLDNLRRQARGMADNSKSSFGIGSFNGGGSVGSPETRIVIQNNGSPKEATGVTMEEDAEGTVISIMMNDAATNGKFIKQLQSVFNLRRQGI